MKPKSVLPLPIPLISLCLTIPAMAVDRTWIGAQDGAYNTTTNWSPNGSMGAGDTAVFDGSAPGSPDQNTTININKMLFKSTAGKAYTPGFGNWNVNVAGTFIEVESGNDFNNMVNPDRGSGPAITLKNGDNTILNNGTGTLTISSGSTWEGNAIRANASGASTLIVDGSGSTIIGTATNAAFKLADNSSHVLSLIKNGGGILTLDTLNTFSGQTLINDGVLRVLNGGALGSSTETRVSGGSTADGRLELSGGITVASENLRIDGRQNASANIASLSNLSGNNEWQGSITVSTGGGNYNIESQSGNLKLSGTLNMGTLNRTWQLMGAGDGEISGVINDGSIGVKVTKLDAGTWTLSNTNTYTGLTTISAGKLVMGDQATDTFATSGVTVASGATLGGSGTIGGTLGVTGILAPGNNIGTLNAGTTTWNGGANTAATIWQFELGAAGVSDKLNITGDFIKGGTGTYKFDFMGSTPTWGATYILVDWSNNITGFNLDASDFSFTGLSSFWNPSTFTIDTTNKWLTFTAVPEPTSTLAGLLLTAGLLRRRRTLVS